ncbi:PHA/PHB synthase family protein [Rhodospirillum rubrum]|uniref:Poly(R)-hydroxyalkanoic acid synthase, class I n=1 Tax=Rhodospirillum rubrum (strain ATCC 11170 / ATH 1.1.1 / DSM 467 / LMG 4362 / NCIMB 8255 / S1) TaxID=269796 RepID=Q2RTC9_RHORT|nr:class I poly(R)-hydroxyalkanoic acid synthase [Rhodospirillum rubrum]ABC22616.1 Poly(R)-hydroxyalkanoic acid synthase, class I [Rhodospirillum rubrum ATCC 11170]AEO48334.1 Poly(R)-hydroxyalkanoic acid synthase, class I [Rhodospirillum rubrum F11]MBK5954204.1 class I poly(R)-hydroxyalkanoic acid synthase [Rhodospirillum rubrum]QXG82239.1 class I poly(R)-hydroxyalkanoic acid synthase [Rhodospirillum rubrum]
MTDTRAEADLTEVWRAWAAWGEKSRTMWATALGGAAPPSSPSPSGPDPAVGGGPAVGGDAARAFLEGVLRPSQPVLDAQAAWARDIAALCQAAAKRLRGEEAAPVIEPAGDDKRFKDDAWTKDPLFDTLKQGYLLTARLVATTLENSGGDPACRQRLAFYGRQVVDALAPTNFAATNPLVRRTALESGGKSLLNGLENLLRDLERGGGRLRPTMSDETAFEVGRTLAMTPGKVVFQNALMQLILYAPTTPKVHKRPLLVVPPWINKFYILDLTEKNSLIKYMVDQGFSVFVISWVNPDAGLAETRFEDYLSQGPLAAMEVMAEITGQRALGLVGYCIGGTLTACTLAVLAARRDHRVKSATLLTTLVDFSEPGELGVFIDPPLLDALDDQMARDGGLDGDLLSMAFNMLRDNDLIWSVFINNYLLGKTPAAFDLLYWNGDSTRMPAAMQRYYLREMYQKNKLVQPGGLTVLGHALDLRRIRTPVYLLSARDDHIAPWTSTFKATGLYGGPLRFVLAGSGHIAGVINPPAKARYGYWTNADTSLEAESWLEGATPHGGSWWPDWAAWAAGYAGPKVAARDPTKGPRPPLEDAPGSYVKVRI